MTLNDLINNVYTITNRSDRAAETLQAVLSATLKAHQSDYFYKDILETGVSFDVVAYIQQLDYRALLPQWRALKYLRKFDFVNNCPKGPPLKIVEPANVFDDYNAQKVDIAYVAGSNININSCTQEQYYLLGCYLNPNITQNGYNSWIALDHPFCIILGAAASVFKAIGKDEEASTYKQLVADELALLKESNITPIGY